MRTIGRWPAAYCAWAALSIATSIALAGLNGESVTRLLVLTFLAAQMLFRRRLTRLFAGLSPRVRFVVMGTLLAAVVEGCHMISTPVFPSLRVGRTTAWAHAASHYAVDLAFTIPAYLVIFSVMWWCVARFRFSTWHYVFVMGLAQAIGDGGLFFFAANPLMLVFLPYPMTNYHAVNVIPFLAVRRDVPDASHHHATVVTLVAIVATYLACGAVIQVVGRTLGYA